MVQRFVPRRKIPVDIGQNNAEFVNAVPFVGTNEQRPLVAVFVRFFADLMVKYQEPVRIGLQSRIVAGKVLFELLNLTGIIIDIRQIRDLKRMGCVSSDFRHQS